MKIGEVPDVMHFQSPLWPGAHPVSCHCFKMSDDAATRRRRRNSNEYQTPESIAIEITEPITITDEGKPQYTTYKIVTEVRYGTHYILPNSAISKDGVAS